MKEIAETYGMCMLYMLSLLLVIVILISFFRDGGLLHEVVRILMNGLTGTTG